MMVKLKKMIFSIWQELYKIVTNYTFLISVAGLAIIILSGTIVTEAGTFKDYNVFQLAFMQEEKRKEMIGMYGLTYERIFCMGTQGYLWMFAPVFVSAPFVVLMCSAKKNSNIRFELFRSGKTEYVLGKLFASLVCGGLVMSLSYALFSVAIHFILPTGNTLGTLDYVKRFTEMFFYGMTSTWITYILSGFMHNRYLVLCIPFMINYFVKTQLNRGKFMGSKIASVVNPGSPSYLFSMEGSIKKWILIFWVGAFIAGTVVYRFALERRCDCGE